MNPNWVNANALTVKVIGVLTEEIPKFVTSYTTLKSDKLVVKSMLI